MIPAFEPLADPEKEALFKAPLLVSILIAGADGRIDHREMKSAIQQAQRHASRARAGLAEFYQTAVQDFEDKLKIVLSSYPHDSKVRNPLIAAELSQLNSIFKRLPVALAKDLYHSLCELASSVASSSGGMFGMNTIGEEEARWIRLPMLHPPGT
jgi:hypothetical protein